MDTKSKIAAEIEKICYKYIDIETSKYSKALLRILSQAAADWIMEKVPSKDKFYQLKRK